MKVDVATASGILLMLLMLSYVIAAVWSIFVCAKDRQKETGFLRWMEACRYILHGVGFFTLFYQTGEERLLVLWLIQLLFFLLSEQLQRRKFKTGSPVLFEYVLMLLSVVFLIGARLSFEKAVRQFALAAVATIGSSFLPGLVKAVLSLLRSSSLWRREKASCGSLPGFLRRLSFKAHLGYVCAGAGLGLLGLVLVNGIAVFGAKNWFAVRKMVFQPSEPVKVLYIAALALLLSECRGSASNRKNIRKNIRKNVRILSVSMLSALHVLFLVFANDFGGALIFFVLYLIMVLVVGGNVFFPLMAIVPAIGAARVAFLEVAHVKERLLAWKDPFSCIDKEGYQIAQSMFAIGNGGWFGTGLYEGMPKKIPVVVSDFVFSAISEELGAFFAALLLCVYVCFILRMLEQGLKQKSSFGFAIFTGAIGLIGFQTFLNIGGVIKLIPLTGVTLPFISYGGSSLVSMILLVRGIQTLEEADAVIQEEPQAGKWKEEEEKNAKRCLGAAAFGAALLLLITIVFFLGVTVRQSEEFFLNEYNPRVRTLESRFLRGRILTQDDRILAQSLLGEDGNQYRIYPYGEAAAFVTGRLVCGETGIEREERRNLLSYPASPVQRLFHRLFHKPEEGNRIRTTIHSVLQSAAQKALQGKKGAVCVMEVTTGRLLAMASAPSVNPNEVLQRWEELRLRKDAPLINRCLEGRYPPGSVFKIVTTLAYLSEHDAKEFHYTCTGSVQVNQLSIHCFEGKAHGAQTLQMAFENSCNCAYVQMGKEIKAQVFRDTAERLLFGTKVTGTLPYALGQFCYEEEMEEELKAQTAFGQGKTLVTPYQLLLLTGAIANRGRLVLPYLVESVETASGETVELRRSQGEITLMSEEEACYMTELMISASGGAMGKWEEEGFLVAGKTGSAQFATSLPAHAWYVCFAPADCPEIAICVLIEQSGTGGQNAVPVARALLNAYQTVKSGLQCGVK